MSGRARPLYHSRNRGQASSVALTLPCIPDLGECHRNSKLERRNNDRYEEGGRGPQGYPWQYVSLPEKWFFFRCLILRRETNRNINKVDATMDQIREQMDISNEISDAISNPVNMGIDVDDVSPEAIEREYAPRLTICIPVGGTQE
jgi:hypothetical protein